MSWVEQTLNHQEQMLREEMAALSKHIEYAERSLVLTMEVNAEDPESMDPELPQKTKRFREYLGKLRETMHQLQSIGR